MENPLRDTGTKLLCALCTSLSVYLSRMCLVVSVSPYHLAVSLPVFLCACLPVPSVLPPSLCCLSRLGSRCLRAHTASRPRPQHSARKWRILRKLVCHSLFVCVIITVFRGYACLLYGSPRACAFCMCNCLCSALCACFPECGRTIG